MFRSIITVNFSKRFPTTLSNLSDFAILKEFVKENEKKENEKKENEKKEKTTEEKIKQAQKDDFSSISED